jgi:hypothetical protein
MSSLEPEPINLFIDFSFKKEINNLIYAFLDIFHFCVYLDFWVFW